MKFTEFLFFRRMLIPIIAQLLFWIAVAICVAVGIFGLFNHDVMAGLGLMIFGPLVARLVCEYIIVFFRISDTLTEIKDMMQKKG